MTKFVRPLIPNLGAIPRVLRGTQWLTFALPYLSGWLRVWLAMWLSSHLSKDALEFANVGPVGVSGLRFCYVLFSSPEHQQTEVSVRRTGIFYQRKMGTGAKNKRTCGEVAVESGKMRVAFSSNRCSSSDLRPRIPPDA